MLLGYETQGFCGMLTGVLLYSQALPAIAAGNMQAGQDVETTPWPPCPPAAIKAHEHGNVRLRITLEKGKVIDVTTVSGPPALALPSARWVKAYWKLRPDISGVYDVSFTFLSKNPYLKTAVGLIRIVVENGRIIEVTPVSGSGKAAAAAADLVKNKWRFSENTNLIVVLPVELQRAK